MTGSGSHLDADTIRDMVRCGVNLVGFDQLTPDDARLPGLVWSWGPNEPADTATGACTAQGNDGRFFAARCATAYKVACRTATGWTLSRMVVRWAGATTACPRSTRFDVPVNGWDNQLLRNVAGSAPVWLAYHHNGTAWETVS